MPRCEERMYCGSGSSCRKDDELEASGAELLREALGVRKQRAARQKGLSRRSNEGDTGTP